MRNVRAWALFVLTIAASACSGRNQDRDAITLVSTIHALVEGLYDGEVTIGEIKRLGDLGTGAPDAMDGEMVLVDGIAYQVKSDGTVAVLDDRIRTPYAAVTPFDADQVLEIREETDFDELKQRVDARLGHQGLPYAFRIEGTFSYVRTRSVPRQVKPYPRLIEVVKKQPEFEFRAVEGIIVGFRLPEHLESLAVPGYHFHFITADRTGGGHLLAFRSSALRVAADLSPNIHAVLPQSRAFSEIDITHRSREELDRIMGRSKP